MKLIRMALTGIICLSIISSCTGKSIGELPIFRGSIGNESDETDESEYTDTLADMTMDEDDRSLFAWLIACEVGDRPYKAQVCFASVLLNRLEDEGFSDSARGVVFESGDFVSVSTGKVSGSVSGAQMETAAYKTALRALSEALESDPTGGALYFGYLSDGAKHLSGAYECGGMVFGR